jgi:predicted nucleic acid-binding Zn ribbon protein
LLESLNRVARSIGGPDAPALTAIFGRWHELVGESIAAHARPAKLSGETLVIDVDEPIWRTQLSFLERELVARLEAVVGGGVVARVEVRVRPPRGRQRTS